MTTATARTVEAARVFEHAPALLPLEQATSPALVGGKAYNLRRAIGAGARVPAGFVLTARALEIHLATYGLREVIDSVIDRLEREPSRHPQAVAREIADDVRALLTGSPLAEPIRTLLHATCRDLLDRGAVVVRSSAVGEDSPLHSFAGQLDSFLHIRTEEALERAVVSCWASCWSERVLAYGRMRRSALRGMAVIVQQQVDARIAGVLFTRVARESDAILVEYTSGLGNALVAGEVTPGRLIVRRHSPAAERLQPPACYDAAVEATLFSPATIRQIVAVADALERGLRAPQDVEWVVDDAGQLHVVQSRPITAAVALPTRRERHVSWSNANVNENFPAPISPLLYSIASTGYALYFRNLAHAFGVSTRRIAAMDDALRHIIGVHGARMYYNLSSIHTVLRSALFGNELVSAFNRFVGAAGCEGHRIEIPASRLAELAELGRIIAKTTWTYRSLGARVAEFERVADDYAAHTAPDVLSSASLRELRLLLADFLNIRCSRWTNAALADAAAMVCYAALHRLIEGARGGGGGRSLHNTLLKAIPNLVSGEPVQRLWELSRLVRGDAALAAVFDGEPALILRSIRCDERFAAFRRELEEYLDRWGFRCSSELMLTLPSFQEDPSGLIDTIRAYARLDGESPAEVLERQIDERERETRRLLRDLRGRRLSRWLPFVSYGRAIRVAQRWTQSAIAFRERARLKQALLYNRCRRVALAMGDHLVASDTLSAREEVFWLTIAELDELASGSAMFPHHARDLVALRTRAHAQLAATEPPDSFSLPECGYLGLEGATRASAGARRDMAGRSLCGTSACGGRATGRAVVLADAREAERLTRGDILVTRQTDPGWAPVFFLISGLVVERGGMLSHGAIVAREFGIPCVVGIENATHRIPEGRMIVVDGDRGSVDVLD